MNIRDLQYLVAVHDMNNFSKAAELCYVSQPTLSGQLKKLETEIFEEAELELGGYEANRMISLIKDVIKLGEHQYAKELILRSEMILDSDETFNEIPQLVELLWAYDEVKAAKWLIRSIK